MADNKFPGRIKELRKSHNLTMEEFGKRIGKSKSTISLWESGQRSPKIWELVNIENTFNVPAETLIYGSEKTNYSQISEITSVVSKLAPHRQDNVLNYSNSQLEEQKKEDNKVININQPQEDIEYETLIVHGLESAGCGCWQEDDVDIEVQIPKKEIPTDFDDLAMVVGDSMRPYLHNSDILFIKFTQQIEVGQIGVFRTSRGNFVKKLQNGYLESLNSEYDDIYFSEDEECEVIGVVVNYYRK